MPKPPPSSLPSPAAAGDSPPPSGWAGNGGRTAPPPDPGKALLAAAALVLLGWLALLPALHGGWLWDDNNEVTENRILRDPGGLVRIWVAPAGPDYFPLKTTVQWVEWHLWGAQPGPYHAVSLALHLASALLVWRLLRRLGVRWAWFGGLLFAVHPLAVESVAWAAELKNTLSLPLLLLALLLYFEYDDFCYTGGLRLRRPLTAAQLGVIRRQSYGLALGFFVLALLAKSSVVMLPVVLLLHAGWKRGRVTGRDWAATAPFFAASLVLGLVTLRFQQHVAIGGWQIDAGAPLVRAGRAGVALAFYLGKCLVPTGLSPLYPRWSFGPLSLPVLLCWAAIIILAVGCWCYRRSWGRHVLFGLGFFVLNLLPVSGLVAISYMHYSWVADHFAYISVIGVVGLAAAGAGALARAIPPWSRPVTAGAAALLVGTFALASHEYARVFHDSETLWHHVLAADPSSWAAHYNLGYAEVQAGQLPAGIDQYEAALQLQPDFPEAQNTLGIALAQQGHLPEAIAHLREALRLQPDYAEAHSNLGLALALTGQVPAAVAEYREALRLKPDDGTAELKLGLALLQENRPAEAIPAFEAAQRLDPDRTDVAAYLAYARQQAAK